MTTYLLCSLTIFLFVPNLAAQAKYEATTFSMRQAQRNGELREYIDFMESKAAEAEKNSDWHEAAVSYNVASLAARHNGQLQKAISLGNNGLAIANKVRDPRLQTQALYFLSVVYAALRQWEKAKEVAEKGLETGGKISQRLVRESFEGLLYHRLGRDFLRRGDDQKAIEYLSYSLQRQESRLGFLKRQNPRALPEAQNTVVISLAGLASAYQRAGNVEEAVKSYEKGIRLIKESGIKTQVEIELYHSLGRIYLRTKDFDRALETLLKALQIAEKEHYGASLYRISGNVGDFYLQTERPAEAIAYYKKAIDGIESTRSLLESEEFRSSFFEDKGQIYGGIILAHLAEGKVAEAFDYNERARSRAFLDILGSKVQLGRQRSLIDEERSLQSRLGELRTRLAGLLGQDDEETEALTDRALRQLRRDLEGAEKAYADFLSRVRKENREQVSLMNVEPLTLKQVQEQLDPGVTLLEYFVVRGRAILWVVEKDRVNFLRLSLNRSELISRVTALRETIYQPGEVEKFKRASEELYKALIEPALAHIRGKELLIIPNDVLHYLPYQALLSPQEKYLIEDFPLHYLSSASLMQFTKEKKRASRVGEKALVMGNPDLGDQAYDLRFAEREAREIARVYPESAVFLRQQATKSKAISLSPANDILHFAVHAEFNEEDPMSSALLLAKEGQDDGRLKVGEVFSFNLKADMVVLSACETGLGKISSGDEIIGLTRAFIYAGTPSVVTTLWKVNDRASYELMREFYSNLKTMKKSEALRQAQLKTMKEFPEPFFWAAYGLTGEP